MIKGNKKIFDINQIDDVFFNRKKTLENIFKDTNKVLNIFDVGANTGQSLKEFKDLFVNSIVHCFEPDVDSYKTLQENNYQNVIYNNVGVGSKKETKIFYSYSLSSINSFLPINQSSTVFIEKVHEKINKALEGKETTSEIKLIKLDSYCKKKKLENIDILKIDVQGYEKKVLKGSKKLLTNSSISVIVLEINFDEMYGKGSSFYDIESKLIPHGYKLWDISHIYKDLKINRTNWVDVIYVNEIFINNHNR